VVEIHGSVGGNFGELRKYKLARVSFCDWIRLGDTCISGLCSLITEAEAHVSEVADQIPSSKRDRVFLYSMEIASLAGGPLQSPPSRK